VRRSDREIRDPAEIESALRSYRVCTLGIPGGGGVRMVPMCFGYRDGYLYFHSAPEGEKVEMLGEKPLVGFSMERALGSPAPDEIHYESVTGRGTVEFLKTPPEKETGISILLEQFHGAPHAVEEKELERTLIFRVRIEDVSMKRNPAFWEKPVLLTERLRMRALDHRDAPELRAAADFPEIARGTASLPSPYTMRDAVAFLADRRLDFLGEGGGVFGLEERVTGALVGCAGITRLRAGAAEIGYWLTPSRWNRGYCTEAVGSLIRHGFDGMGLFRISAAHFPDNPASGRVLEKTGMSREGILRGYMKKDGVCRDVVLWSVLKSDQPRRLAAATISSATDTGTGS
jgi:RimJ/RimL family protein N-acetyltransferase